jgi:hypothetical protein
MPPLHSAGATDTPPFYPLSSFLASESGGPPGIVIVSTCNGVMAVLREEAIFWVQCELCFEFWQLHPILEVPYCLLSNMIKHAKWMGFVGHNRSVAPVINNSSLYN